MSHLMNTLLNLNDYIIPIMWIFCGFELAFGFILYKNSGTVNKKMSSKNEKDYKIDKANWINVLYNLFTGIISLFPMLGMLGTVLGLLSLDLTQGNTDNLKQSFFFALDTTAWGLVFSIIWKLIHAGIQNRVESAIEKINKIKEICNEKC